jgi:hypothetical protein
VVTTRAEPVPGGSPYRAQPVRDIAGQLTFSRSGASAPHYRGRMPHPDLSQDAEPEHVSGTRGVLRH